MTCRQEASDIPARSSHHSQGNPGVALALPFPAAVTQDSLRRQASNGDSGHQDRKDLEGVGSLGAAGPGAVDTQGGSRALTVPPSLAGPTKNISCPLPCVGWWQLSVAPSLPRPSSSMSCTLRPPCLPPGAHCPPPLSSPCPASPRESLGGGAHGSALPLVPRTVCGSQLLLTPPPSRSVGQKEGWVVGVMDSGWTSEWEGVGESLGLHPPEGLGWGHGTAGRLPPAIPAPYCQCFESRLLPPIRDAPGGGRGWGGGQQRMDQELRPLTPTWTDSESALGS